MSVTTYEATVENGQIKLSDRVRLPEHARVYVIVPGAVQEPPIHIRSPRLKHPEQAGDFAKEVSPESHDAGV